MSHIPSSAMPHAKPHEPETAEPDAVHEGGDRGGAHGPDWGFVAMLAGGVVAVGAVAAAAVAAVPLLRGRAAPKRERRERKKAKKQG